MKTTHIFACLATLCPVASADTLPPALEATAPQESAATTRLPDRLCRILEALEHIQNKTEADQLARQLMAWQAEQQQRNSAERFRIERALHEAGYTDKRLTAIAMHLQKNGFFGSEALANLYGESLQEDPVPLPQSLQEQYTIRLQEAVQKYKLPLSGGPGFTQETAWKLSSGYVTDLLPLLENCLNQEAELVQGWTQLSNEGDTDYEAHYYEIFTDQGMYEIMLWFDVTACQDTPPPVQQPELSAERRAALSPTAKKIEGVLTLLDSVSDTATADAAAGEVAALVQELKTLSQQETAPQIWEIEQVLAEMGICKEDIDTCRRRIYAEHMYGSVALGKALGASPHHYLVPTPLPPELTAQYEACMQQAVRTKKLPVTGGPGLSQETAWVLAAEGSPEVLKELAFSLPQEHDLHRMFISRTTLPDGRCLECQTMQLMHNGALHEIEIYLDITAWREHETPKPAPRANTEEAEQALAATLHQLCTLLDGVNDKTTADAAAAPLKRLMAQLEQQINSISDPETLQQIFDAAGLSIEEDNAYLQRFRKTDFYGSESLKKTLSTP